MSTHTHTHTPTHPHPHSHPRKKGPVSTVLVNNLYRNGIKSPRNGITMFEFPMKNISIPPPPS